MTDATYWYYAEGSNSVGPLSLTELISIFSRVSDAKSIFVWRDGFASWRTAGTVPEIARHILKPPPVPGTPRAQLQTTQTAVPQITTSEASTKPQTNKKDLVGIGGWLILVAIGQVLAIFKCLAFLLNYYSSLDPNVWIKFPIAAYGEAILNTSYFVIIAWTTYLLFSKSRLFPRFYIFQYVAVILLFPLDIIFSSALLSAYTGQPVEVFVDKMIDPKDVGQWIALFIPAAIWIPYIKRSKRVANTFGKAGFTQRQPRSNSPC